MTAEPTGPTDATLLMAQAAGGDPSAAERLLPLIDDQLRRAAQLQMAGERKDHTLSATALVHEAYLKLVGAREVPWAGRGHFYAAATEAMLVAAEDEQFPASPTADRLRRRGA